MRNHTTIHIIKPNITTKYKKLCNNIHKRSRQQYISYDNNKKPIINIPRIMELLIEKLKPAVNKSFIRHSKYKEIDFVCGIIDVISNNTYWSRYKGSISGKYLNKRHLLYCRWGFMIAFIESYSTCTILPINSIS